MKNVRYFINQIIGLGFLSFIITNVLSGQNSYTTQTNGEVYRFGYAWGQDKYRDFLIKAILALHILCIFTLTNEATAQTLTADGATYEIDYTGSIETFTIPETGNLNGYSAISFLAKGGDGGKRRVNSFTKAKGGGGASTEGTFAIGTGTGQLKPGGRIRFVVGRRGESQTRNGVSGSGGGGGTAVLYTEAEDADITCLNPAISLEDADECWVVLMIAGGGGGAYGSGFGATRGKNGRAEECGNDGDGSRGGNGGCGGSGGSSAIIADDGNTTIRRAGGGGGMFTKGQNEKLKEAGGRGGFDGGSGGIQSIDDKNIRGGFGYGGGGSGSFGNLLTTAGGGGGGGYSGGGGGDTARGGGGGSYVNAAAAFPDKRDGNADGSPDNGRITYQFESSIGGANAKCQDLEVTLNGGIAVLVPDQIDDGSTANELFFLRFEIGTSLEETFAVSCNELGENTVSLVVVTASGFTNKCTAVIDVIDDTAPTITCNTTPITASVSLGAPYVLDPSTIITSFFDGCGTQTELYATQEVFTCEDIGTQTISIVAEDESANEGTCDVSVTITGGSELPSITCPNDVVVSIDNVNACPAIVSSEELIPMASAPCVFDLSYEISNANGSVYQSGTGFMPNTSFAFETNTVTYTLGANFLTDPKTCTFTVSLSGNFRDDQPFICLDDVNRNLVPEDNCEYFLSGSNYNTIFFACYDNVEVDFEYTDATGQVTNEGPFDGFNPPDRIFGVGVTEVIFSMYVGTLVETCSFQVNVNDVTPPTAICKDLTVNVNNNCKASFPASDFDAGSSDDCGNFTFLRPGFSDMSGGISIDIPPSPTFTLSGTGAQTVTVLVTDDSGNESTCTQVVTLVDNSPPTAVCVPSLTIGLSESPLLAIQLDGGSTDNCTENEDLSLFMVKTTSGSPAGEMSNLGCGEVGDLPITLHVSDQSNNTSTCTVTVEV
ncbi:MAG: hypothetical protein MI974_08605, partial [Chitinophagales bacterium]|nr:hypothetical protein [Chitinophagales bacterium]